MATILGNDNSNILSGTSGSDKLMGDGGLLDIINGGAGNDISVYQGGVLEYNFANILGQLFIYDSNFCRDGIDWLISIEYVQFNTSVNDFKNNVNHNASLYHLIVGNNSSNILNGDTVGALTNQDLMLGFSGNDTFNLGGGMDVAYGYGGIDTFNYNTVAANGVASHLGYTYLDGGANTDTVKLDFTGFAANGLTVAALQAAFNASNHSQIFDFSTIDSRIHLKIINIENLVITNLVEVVNQAPVAVADSTPLINENTSFSANVLVNDTDADGDTLTVSNAGIYTLTHGTLTINANGSYTYAATNDSLTAGQLVSDVFNYQISDGHGGTANANLTISVQGVNDAPVLSPIAAVSIVEGTGLSVATSFVDPDVGDTHTFSLIGAPSWMHIDANTGLLTLDPTVFPGNSAVNQSVTVRVTDSAGAFSDQNWDVTVTGNPRLFDTQVDDASFRTLTNLATGTPDLTIWHMPAHNPATDPAVLGNMLSVSMNILNRYQLTLNDGAQFGQVTFSDIAAPSSGVHQTVQIGLDMNNNGLIDSGELVNVDLFSDADDFDVLNSDFLQLTGNITFLLGGLDAVIGTTGNDYIHAGEDTDTVRGDSALLNNAVGGNDTIIGGGGTDTLYGDAVSMSSSTGGNDTLIGGGGVDFLYGDAPTLINSIAGSDILNGGKGNDILTGDSEPSFSPNTYASDTFVFNLADGGDGNDNITDFNIGGASDFLSFENVVDANNNGDLLEDLLAMSRVVNNGVGNAQMQFTFDGGSTWGTASINFNNVVFSGQSEVTDIALANHIMVNGVVVA